MISISFDKYKEKVQGCFIGKCVGGTLGMPYEGDTGVREVSFYDPVPDTMLPNDDLDLQVVNLETIMRTGLPICRYYLSEIWKYHIDESTPDEYGVALSNNRTKIFAPLSGQYRNKFTAGMGGAIRSELWACLAPANPGLAAELAREDACTDHSEDGIYAEMFLAAVESAAFVESDLQKLVEIGLKFVPQSSRMHDAFSDTILWWKESNDVMTVREKILGKYKVDNWTDVTINLSFILLSLISCGDSFDKAICTAAMLGYDTDCTAATVGSVFGIINPSAIDKKWTDPIGDGLVLSPCIINMHSPDTITEFCENIMAVSFEVQSYYNTDVNITDIPNTFEMKKVPVWTDKYKSAVAWEVGAKESLISVAPVMLNVVYPENVVAIPGEKNKYCLKLMNISNTDLKGNVSLEVPCGWNVALNNHTVDIKSGEVCEIPFEVSVSEVNRRCNINILSIIFNINGLRYEFDCNLPVSVPWTVKDMNTGAEYKIEVSMPCFEVPNGAFSYKAAFFATGNKTVRISAGGRRKFKLYINGEAVFSSDGSFFVPTFHRDDTWTTININRGENTVEAVFEESEKGEFFLGFSTIYECSTWLDNIEFA